MDRYIDKNNHEHKWNENLKCVCGATLDPPVTVELAPQKKQTIQIMVELRQKITDALDNAMEEILKGENPND